MRKFAIPFNGSDPDDFLKRLEPYKEYVDHIFFGLPAFFDTHRQVEWSKEKFVSNLSNSKEYLTTLDSFNTTINNIEEQEYNNNVLLFLEKTKNGKYKRFLTLNKIVWELDSNVMEFFVKTTLTQFVNYYKIEGILIGEFEFAKYVRKYLPDAEIHLSLCSKLRDLSSILKWDEEIHISSFNIPPSFSRNKSLIERVKDSGIRTKMLVNESCVCGCPMDISHYCYVSRISDKKRFYSIYCDDNKLREAFRGCFILPRHLKLFDDCIDVFKISTRHTKSDILFKNIDYYINEIDDDSNVWDLIRGRMFKRLKQIHNDYNSFNIPINKIPDKVIFCECVKCRNCDICKKLMEKFFDDGGVSNLKHLI